MSSHSALPWSHFAPLPGKSYFLGFSVETCETCGNPAQAANAINLHEPRERLLSLGLTELPAPLPEQFYNDEIGQCDCESCHK